MRAKKWREAILRAIARASGGKGVDAGLDRAADKLVALAMDGDKWALEELGNRVDGKPPQAIIGDDDGPPIRFTRIERVVIQASETPAADQL